jgi:hypothetical protein
MLGKASGNSMSNFIAAIVPPSGGKLFLFPAKITYRYAAVCQSDQPLNCGLSPFVFRLACG